MKIIIKQDQLVSALNIVSRAISSKASIPILGGIAIKATDDCITFIGSNGTESIIHELEVDGLEVTVEEKGAIVAPTNFITIAKKLGKEISITIEESNLHIQSGKSKFDLNGMDAAEYPSIKFETEKPVLSLEKDEFSNIVERTAYAAAQTDTRPILQGVHFHLNGRAEINCTDSHRLANVIREGEFEEELQAVIPAHALINVNKVIQEGNVDLFIDDHQVVFRNESTTYITRLLEGTFPEVSRLLPTDFQTTVKVSTKALRQSLELVNTIGKNGVVKLDINDKGLSFTNQEEGGKVSDRIDLNEFNGEEMTLSFSVPYALDALKAIQSDELQINLQNDHRPFIFQDPSNQNETHLLLPVRT